MRSGAPGRDEDAVGARVAAILGRAPGTTGWVPREEPPAQEPLPVDEQRLLREHVADASPLVVRRLGMLPRAALAAVAVALLVCLGGLLRVMTTSTEVVPLPVGPAAGRTAAAAAPATSPAAAPGSMAGTSETGGRGVGTPAGGVSPSSEPAGGAAATSLVVVHVVGQVRRSGVVRLRPGSRVADAVQAAGGAREGADLARVNLARVLADGEQVFVPRVGEPLPVAPPGATGVAGQGTGQSTGQSTGQAALVDLNTADLQMLDTLPGVGPVIAERILTWRTQRGSFTSVDELAEVEGIGPKLLEALRPLVTL